MKQRSPIAVFFLGLITLGIYAWYWAVKTKGEMNQRGEHVPTAWIWLIPIAGSIWWYWKYSQAVGHVTNGKLDPILAFILLFFLSIIGQAIVQSSFNEVGATAVPVGTPTPGPVPGQPAAFDPTGPANQPVPSVLPTEPSPTPPLPMPPTPPTAPAPPVPPAPMPPAPPAGPMVGG